MGIYTTLTPPVTFDFRFIIFENSQKIYINGNLILDKAEQLGNSYWWTFAIINHPGDESINIEWLKITTPEFGDLTNLY